MIEQKYLELLQRCTQLQQTLAIEIIALRRILIKSEDQLRDFESEKLYVESVIEDIFKDLVEKN